MIIELYVAATLGLIGLVCWLLWTYIQESKKERDEESASDWLDRQ